MKTVLFIACVTLVSKCLWSWKKINLSLAAGLCKCVLGRAFKAHPGHLQLCLSLHFLPTWSLKVKQSWELSSFLYSFSSCIQACAGLLDFLVYVSIHQNSNLPKHCTPKPFLPSLSVGLLFAPIYVLCHMWKQVVILPLNVFDQCPLHRCFSTLRKSHVREIKASSWLSSFREPVDRSKKTYTISWDQVLSAPSGLRSTYQGCQLQDCHQDGEYRMDKHKLKYHETLTDFSCPFLD